MRGPKLEEKIQRLKAKMPICEFVSETIDLNCFKDDDALELPVEVPSDCEIVEEYEHEQALTCDF